MVYFPLYHHRLLVSSLYYYNTCFSLYQMKPNQLFSRSFQKVETFPDLGSQLVINGSWWVSNQFREHSFGHLPFPWSIS